MPLHVCEVQWYENCSVVCGGRYRGVHERPWGCPGCPFVGLPLSYVVDYVRCGCMLGA